MGSSLTRVERHLIRVVRLLMQPGRIFIAVGRRMPFGSYELRCALDLYPRPHYAYGVQQAAVLAQRLGVPRVSVIEFGVAGGQGLVELDRMAEAATAATGVAVDIYGFDRGEGLPKPTDYRDLPYIWREGDFTMDLSALRHRVRSAQLILGDIEDTVEAFLERRDVAPIGFVSVDVDYYSSAAAALKLFRGSSELFLPRVFCYLDDTVGDDDQIIHNDYVGELRAVAEFNETSAMTKIAPVNGLSAKRVVPAPWNDLIYVAHFFEHPAYARYVGRPDRQAQLPLNS
jgi:hypothetical protein